MFYSFQIPVTQEIRRANYPSHQDYRERQHAYHQHLAHQQLQEQIQYEQRVQEYQNRIKQYEYELARERYERTRELYESELQRYQRETLLKGPSASASTCACCHVEPVQRQTVIDNRPIFTKQRAVRQRPQHSIEDVLNHVFGAIGVTLGQEAVETQEQRPEPQVQIEDILNKVFGAIKNALQQPDIFVLSANPSNPCCSSKAQQNESANPLNSCCSSKAQQDESIKAEQHAESEAQKQAKTDPKAAEPEMNLIEKDFEQVFSNVANFLQGVGLETSRHSQSTEVKLENDLGKLFGNVATFIQNAAIHSRSASSSPSTPIPSRSTPVKIDIKEKVKETGLPHAEIGKQKQSGARSECGSEKSELSMLERLRQSAEVIIDHAAKGENVEETVESVEALKAVEAVGAFEAIEAVKAAESAKELVDDEGHDVSGITAVEAMDTRGSSLDSKDGWTSL
jgi:hypothetical protein